MANISEKKREARLRWLKHVERESNEKMEDGNDWTSKDRKTKTGVERCNTKTDIKEKGVQTK